MGWWLPGFWVSVVFSIDLPVFEVLASGFDLVVVTSDFCLLWRCLSALGFCLGRFLGFAVSGVVGVLSLVWFGFGGLAVLWFWRLWFFGWVCVV